MIAVSDVKSHLVGLGPWLDAAAQSKFKYDDSVIAERLVQVVRKFERDTKYRINPVQVVSAPDGTYDLGQAQYSQLPGGSMLLFEDGYHYTRDMAENYFTIQLRQWPVVTVQRLRVVIGTQTVFAMPSTWFAVEHRTGVFSIQPVYGALLISSLNAFSALEFTFGPKDYLRNCIRVDYQVGLPVGWESISDFSDVHLCLTQLGALQVLKDVSEMADAGLTSVSAGGDQRSYSRFRDRKAELERDTSAFMSTFVGEETPSILLGTI